MKAQLVLSHWLVLCDWLTWLGVSVVHCVAIQLEKLHRLGLLLSVAAHGKRVLTHLQPVVRETIRDNRI